MIVRIEHFVEVLDLTVDLTLIPRLNSEHLKPTPFRKAVDIDYLRRKQGSVNSLIPGSQRVFYVGLFSWNFLENSFSSNILFQALESPKNIFSACSLACERQASLFHHRCWGTFHTSFSGDERGETSAVRRLPARGMSKFYWINVGQDIALDWRPLSRNIFEFWPQ